jgi:hypothetical protein
MWTSLKTGLGTNAPAFLAAASATKSLKKFCNDGDARSATSTRKSARSTGRSDEWPAISRTTATSLPDLERSVQNYLKSSFVQLDFSSNRVMTDKKSS